MTFLLDLTLLLVSWTHVYLAPYSKVEESFNLHATHDVLMYGVGATKLHSVSLRNQRSHNAWLNLLRSV